MQPNVVTPWQTRSTLESTFRMALPSDTPMQASPVDTALILIVDPNADHRDIIQRVLQGRPNQYRLVLLRDAGSALDFLYQRGEFTTAVRPHLILLDLNLPDQDGRDLLTEIKADAQLRRIPVIVLTTSDAPADVFRCYAEQGNCYVIKALDQEQLSETIQRIEAFWLEIVTLPQE
jgi:chemotaxis family two-component system response regulator Rcp1